MTATALPAPPNSVVREERRLLIRYHREGDSSAHEQLVERFLPLARRLARRYGRIGVWMHFSRLIRRALGCLQTATEGDGGGQLAAAARAG